MTVALIVALVVLIAIGVVFLRHKPPVLGLFVAVAVLPLLLGSVGGALIATSLALSILLAQPLYVVIGAVTLLCFEYLSDVPPNDYGIFPEKIFELTDKNVLLAIPFFVVSGAIMTHGSIARRLIEFAKQLTSWLPGGMPIAAVGGCVLFAAISGSSPVTVIAIGGMMFPALVKSGFGERQSIGILTAAGSLGIVIPPSIPMIIYAIVVSGRQPIDVGDLFLAGVGPGMLIGLLLTSYIVVLSLVGSSQRYADLAKMAKGLAIVTAPFIVGELLAMWLGPWFHFFGPVVFVGICAVKAWASFLDGFWALMLPVLILGGIYTGFFTPTEAAAVSVVYALVVEIYIYGELKWKDLPKITAESTVMMGALIIIMVIAFVFNDF
ncbi:MAG: TRAP transporter large permease subunit, partial [Myxococcota bacterium]